MSKGSTQRPRSISQDEWESRWDAIFQRDEPEQPTSQPQPVSNWGESPNLDLRKDQQ